jgi:hypothetical protein
MISEPTLQGVSVGPFCTVGASVRIGDGCQLHTGSHVMGHTELGEGCVVLTYDGISLFSFLAFTRKCFHCLLMKIQIAIKPRKDIRKNL